MSNLSLSPEQRAFILENHEAIEQAVIVLKQLQSKK
jgi:hypothetical protein